MIDLKIRCSSIGKIMTEPKTKAEGVLSVGAKTHIRQLIAQDIFGVDFEVSSKEMDKGILLESDAIDLLNRVRGLNLAKNTERRSNEWITGECDLFNEPVRVGHDIKCSWSVATFPIAEADCVDKLYEWQMRGYMWLWNASQWEVNYVLLSTPEHLTRYEPASMHFVDHVPEHLRLTTWIVARDAGKELLIAEKVEAARVYASEIVKQLSESHVQLTNGERHD